MSANNPRKASSQSKLNMAIPMIGNRSQSADPTGQKSSLNKSVLASSGHVLGKRNVRPGKGAGKAQSQAKLQKKQKVSHDQTDYVHIEAREILVKDVFYEQNLRSSVTEKHRKKGSMLKDVFSSYQESCPLLQDVSLDFALKLKSRIVK